MLINRIQRILLPFLVAVLVVYPMVCFSFVFSSSAFAGATSPLRQATEFIVSGAFLPFQTVHLWFLYYLAMNVFICWMMAIGIRKDAAFTTTFARFFTYVFRRTGWRILTMAVVLYGCLYWMGGPFLKTSYEWQLKPDIFITYFVFFGAGWMIYMTNTLKYMGTYPIGQLGLATCLLFTLFLPWPDAPWVLTAQISLSALFSILFAFGFIALFQRYFNQYSLWQSYLMESAYWVYIIHLPIVSFIPGLLAGYSLSAFLKFSITLCSTTLLSLLSYHYLVRNTFVGKFLNGKIHPPLRVRQFQ